MSYDLAVCEPSAAPREPAAFRDWFGRRTEWSESHGYGDPSVPSPALRDWYEMIVPRYPDLQDPNLSDDETDDPRITDYSSGSDLIYAAFRWSCAEDAYDCVRELAVRCQVGFYDVSGDEGDGEICFPGNDLKPPSSGAWRRVAADLRELEGRQ